MSRKILTLSRISQKIDYNTQVKKRNWMPQNAVNLTDISCPETGMIFCDPVTFANTETGTKQVYERVMLLHWYKLQNMHCPYDNEILTDDQIVKDNIMRKKIDSFIAENPQHIEAIRYRKYHDKEANWRKHHTSQDPNAFAYDQIKQYRTNCYVPEPKNWPNPDGKLPGSSVNIGYPSVFRIIYTQCILKYQFIYHRDCWHVICMLVVDVARAN